LLDLHNDHFSNTEFEEDIRDEIDGIYILSRNCLRWLWRIIT